MLIDLVEARPVGDQVLYLRSADGVEGEVDIDPDVLYSAVTRRPLRISGPATRR